LIRRLGELNSLTMEPIYNKIGQGYDTTRHADPEILQNLFELLSIENDGYYMDVACGTGNYTIELAKRGGNWFAFDQSALMIAEARHKSSSIHWSIMDVENISYAANKFNSALCSLAIHHFKDLNSAFKEISRLLIHSGRFVIFTSTPKQMQGYWLNHYFPVMMQSSIEKMPALENITSALNNAGFSLSETRKFNVTNSLTDLFLYSGKQRPEIYLSKSIRAGISSFHNLCTKDELTSGLSKLESDLKSGKIYEVIANYKNENGDYCFITATKSSH
jgi:ubiquinone/menaquinone biosynthesis C-methylase UbiE